MTKKTLFLSLILLASLTLAALVYVQITKPEPSIPVNTNQNANINQGAEIDTSNWKTYKNEQYGFEFKYPGDWDFATYPEEQKNRPEFTIFNHEWTPYGADGDLSINLVLNEASSDLDSWFDKNDKYNEEKITDLIKKSKDNLVGSEITRDDLQITLKEALIDGNRAILQKVIFYKTYYLEGPPYTIKNYFIKNGNTVLNFQAVTPTGKQSEDLIKKADKVIYTIKF